VRTTKKVLAVVSMMLLAAAAIPALAHASLSAPLAQQRAATFAKGTSSLQRRINVLTKRALRAGRRATVRGPAVRTSQRVIALDRRVISLNRGALSMTAADDATWSALVALDNQLIRLDRTTLRLDRHAHLGQQSNLIPRVTTVTAHLTALRTEVWTRWHKPPAPLPTPTPFPSPTPSDPTPTPTPSATPTVSPAPTPTPQPTPTALKLDLGISYGDTLMGLNDQDLAAELDDATTLGVGWIRLDLAWDDIQPDNASSYDWSDFDRVVHAAQARGLSLLPTIDYTPSWARAAGATSDKWAPADPAQFAAFAAAAVQRYAPQGIHTWEIWNEPNTSVFWAPSPDPQAYVKLLSLTVAAMRSCDPHVFIVSGGLAPEATDDGDISQLQYFASMCALGANRLVNAIGYHPYSFPVAPQDPVQWNAWAQIATTTSSFRTFLAQYGTPSLPIWATEYGAPTDGPGTEATAQGWDLSANPDHVDEAFQAILATDSVEAALNTPGVCALFWYTDKDLGTDPSTTENFFGLRRADGTPKPAFYALQSAIKQYGTDSPTP